MPCRLVHHNGRLYLNEFSFDEEIKSADDDDDDDYETAGKRILVLTPQGETLQVWNSPSGREVLSMVVTSDERMVVTTAWSVGVRAYSLTGV